jgi:hypothetical protein
VVCCSVRLVCLVLSERMILSWYLLLMSVRSHMFVGRPRWRNASARIQYGLYVRVVCTNIIDVYG